MCERGRAGGVEDYGVPCSRRALAKRGLETRRWYTRHMSASPSRTGRREALHQLIDDLPEQDLPVVTRILEGLRATGDPVLRALMSAPVDDESDDDDFDGGLTEARREAREEQGISHEEAKRELGLA